MLFIGNNLRLDGTPLRSGGVFCRSLSCTTSFPELGFAVCHLRCRLFPEPLFSSLKSGNSPSAQTARIFTFTSQMLFIGNNLRLDGIPLRSGGVFCRSLSCTTSFPELGFAVCHLRCRLFPEPLFSSLKSGNSPSAQTARIFTFTSQMLFIGNNLRLDGIPLRSGGVFLKGAILHYFLSGAG